MKIALQSVLFALLLAGILAAVSHPSHSEMMIASGETGAPTPVCSPWDGDCDPGPAFNAPETKTVGEGPGPIPGCSPWDKSCNPGPQFPKGTYLAPAGEGSGSIPQSSPDPGSQFPEGTRSAPSANGDAISTQPV